MGRLSGRLALITGAGQGIGQAIAAEFAANGAAVALVDRNPAGVEETAAALVDGGAVIRSFAADITDYDRMRVIRDSLVEEFGRIDILVNNAAVAAENADLLQSSLEDWRRVNRVNLEAAYVLSRLVAEIMAAGSGGRIINIASIQAFLTTGRKGSYNAAKAGLVGLTHSMAVELAPHNIVVNAIAPGFIRTPMSRAMTGEDETDTPAFRANYLDNRRIPMGRAGLPGDVAGTALFLASDDCRYMTGQVLAVDGGLSITI